MSSEARSPLAAPPREQIHPLTGIRIIAAVWVVFFHIRGNLYLEFPWTKQLAPILDNGALGVDMFYVLSGYVLVITYGSRMGTHFDLTTTLRFWWTRIARIWPAYVVTLVIAAVWHGWLSTTERFDPVPPRDFTVPSFIRQALLVDQWFAPDSDRLFWNGAAWTVSAEALAYLFFPLLILLVWRFAATQRRTVQLVAPMVAIAPVALLIAAMGNLYADWMWLMRIACGFLSGMLLAATIHHWDSPRSRQVADILGILLPLGIVGGVYAMDRMGLGHLGSVFLIPVMMVTVGAFALSRRGASRILGSRPFVFGGKVSYSVYLVHMPIIEVLWYLQNTNPAFHAGGTLSKIGFLLIPVLVLASGSLLWRLVEEPARLAMKRMSIPRERAIALQSGEL